MASMQKLKSMIFTSWLCYVITRINVILSGIYLQSWFSWLGRGVQKTSRKILKQTKETLINEDKEKRRIQGKSNNNSEQHWVYLFHKKICFALKYSSKR